jgi:GAF domain-containing protein
MRENPVRPTQASVLGRAVLEGKVVHVTDVLADPNYLLREQQKLGTYRTALGVPMLREGIPVGVLMLTRSRVLPFTSKQIELVGTFADQAVIAIENARLLSELRQRTDDLSESLEQQTATSEVLKIISSSPGELKPVFEAMLAKATELCEASYGALWLREEDNLRNVAFHGSLPAEFTDHWNAGLVVSRDRDIPVARAIRSGKPVHVADLREDPAYRQGHPLAVELADIAGIRTTIGVPMFKDNEFIGAIAVYRKEVRPFTEKQIELVKNFAAQAVIAIENARLLNELRESLQQQTATADVLKVISSSPGDLEPVFQAMLQKATQICEAKFGVMFRFTDNKFRAISWLDNIPAYIIEHPHVVGENPHNFLTRIVSTKRPVHSSDLTKERAYIEGNPRIVALVETAGARSLLVVPMVKNEELIGAIAIYWQEVRSFTEKQVELISNFAAQAVIAIDNARLLGELRESLQQQTATADVLKVISSSPGELEPVFNTMLEKATRTCDAEFGTLYLRETDSFRAVAVHNAPPAYVQARKGNLVRPPPDSALGQVAATHQVAQVEDAKKIKSYVDGDPYAVSAVELGGYRTIAAVPMLKDDELVGAILIYRQEVRLFSEKQIVLLQNFAAQAVIAIENTRLLNELRESLQQQTATADVLKVISRSTFDLQTVLQTLVESAARLCDADKAQITRERNGAFIRAEDYGFSQEFMDYVKDTPIKVERGSMFGRALLEGRVVQVPDVTTDPEYTFADHQRLGGYRTVLAVPMLREGVSIGVLILARSEVRPFAHKQIEIATTFADQAAIAIENVRLFERVEARTRELAASLEKLRTTQDRLVQTQKLASLGQLTAGIAHEIKNPLNFVNNFSGISVELIDELQGTLTGPLDDKARAEIKELTDTLRGNLDKVMQHGRRADAIVKNMLQHSREGSGEHRVVDINAIVEESLNLAWHGARAEKKGFDVTLERSFDPSAGEADIYPQDITRALLNLINNGFYAATKRKADTNGGDYAPTLATSTKSLGDRIEILIRDNGTGISSEVKDKMFNPFFTTKPTGEGTGLGLSISHDIIVKQHGGSIEVETKPGEFTEIRVILPRVAVFV